MSHDFSVVANFVTNENIYFDTVVMFNQRKGGMEVDGGGGGVVLISALVGCGLVIV
jgi:hypothetical protein